ncbi:hypothetical protein H7A76_30690 [Pseudomonas sp. MSSRFD41]|uniref:hypothetical protein n=1 Tax=Pseudomonas sp. MSSRFD41 TaxID=1310370 RepID=UPI00163A6872|nr:hypothetical protein [Pseudomonas sp. MSSRFD41]MBC2659824.1 hypothetical protein [Pseudomonas sp. MSSRFD41]
MSSFKCVGIVGTNKAGCTTYEDDYILPEGSVWVDDLPPMTGPDRFGEWIVEADGTYSWHKLPDPPFPVVYHEGKIKNSDTLVELPENVLPGNIAVRIASTESTLVGISTAMSAEVQNAHDYAQQASQSAASAEAAKQAVDDAIAALPKPTQFEMLTAVLGAGGLVNVLFTKTYTSPPVLIPVTRFVGDQAFIPVIGVPTLTGVEVTGKRTRGTLLLTSGPFESAAAGDTVQFVVIGR